MKRTYILLVFKTTLTLVLQWKKFFFIIMSGFAEIEANLIRERVLSGLDTAKENCVKLGRHQKQIDVNKIVTLYTADNRTVTDIAKLMNLSRPTIYKHLKEQKVIQIKD